MRRTTFLSLTLFVGTVGIAAACSEQQPASPTAPAAGISTSQAIASSPTSPAAKPTPAPVGFTKITTVTAGPTILTADSFGSAWAECPVGTTVIGGGFDFGGYKVTNPAWVKTSRASLNGWLVNVINEVVNSGVASFTVYAYCAS